MSLRIIYVLMLSMALKLVSISVHLMEGDYDDHLAWPVKGTLTVQLLNQLSDQ